MCYSTNTNMNNKCLSLNACCCRTNKKRCSHTSKRLWNLAFLQPIFVRVLRKSQQQTLMTTTKNEEHTYSYRTKLIRQGVYIRSVSKCTEAAASPPAGDETLLFHQRQNACICRIYFRKKNSWGVKTSP